MDPITGAIVAAVAAGVTEIGKQAVVDAYGALKGAIKRKFGDDSGLVEAVDKLEEKPQSAGWKEEVETQVKGTEAAEDAELQELAQALLQALEGTAEGKQALAKYNIQAGKIGIAGDHAKVEGDMNF